MLLRIAAPVCVGLLTVSAPQAPSSAPQEPSGASRAPVPAPAVQPRPDTWPRAQWISAIATAQAEARATGKPLLVLVVPEEPAAARTRGELLGAVLERADEEFLIDLACCEVACAPVSELHRLTGELLLPADPLALIAEYDSGMLFGARAVRVAPYSDLARVCKDGLTDCEGACQRALQQLIRGDGGRAGIAARQRESDAAELPGVLAGVRGGASLPTWLVDRWAPQLAELAEPVDVPQRAFVRERLLAVVRRELLEEPPRGAAWAIQRGFVYELDGQRSVDTCPPCGMGHVTKDARRFLSFYAGTEFERLGGGR